MPHFSISQRFSGPPRPPGARRFLLDAGEPIGNHLLLCQLSNVPTQAGQRSIEQLGRVIKAHHSLYGKVELDQNTFAAFQRNFEADTWGQEVYLDLNHDPQHGILAKFVRVFQEGDTFKAELEWTQFGIDEARRTGFQYFSLDFTGEYEDPETGTKHGPMIFGAGLVPRPFIRRMQPLSGPQANHQTHGAPDTARRFQLSNGREGYAPPWINFDTETPMKDFLKKLSAKLKAKKLAPGLITQILAAAERHAKALGDNASDDQLNLIMPIYEEMGDMVLSAAKDSGQGGEKTLKLEFPEGLEKLGAAQQKLSADDLNATVAGIVKKLADENAQSAKQLADAETAKRKLFSDAIDAEEGLSDEVKTQLKADTDTISHNFSDEQVQTLAASAIKLGHQLEVQNQKLASGMQFAGGGGHSHIQMGGDNSAHKLQAEINTALKGTSMGSDMKLQDPQEFAKANPKAAKILALFDQVHGPQLAAEAKALAAGQVDTNSTSLPSGFQRTVIQEALSDLNILNLVNVETDPTAQATTQIPYELRDTQHIQNDGIVYEDTPIPLAGVSQHMDTAQIVPMKLAMQISNEGAHFSRASPINFDAYARTVSSNARVMRELLHRRLANTMQRSADGYLATAVANENIAAKLDGTNDTIKLDNFPLVRPFQERDLKGAAIGSETHPIVFDFGGTPVYAYDGTGNQAAGTYYRVTNYNLSFIQFVDETGQPVQPNEAAATVSYHTATNVTKFNTDFVVADTTLERHLNGAIRAIGAQKALMSGDRQVMPNAALCSPVLHDTVSNAQNFENNSQRMDAGITAAGAIDQIKQIPFWGTNAPGLDLGDERILLMERGVLTYKVAKPYVMGAPYEITDAATGKPVGKRGAYGEEYSAIKVPGPLAERLSSVLVYSEAARAAVA